MHRLSISRIFWTIVTLSLIFYTVTNFQTLKTLAYSSPCEVPITYRIDEVDPRFKLNKEQFLTDIKVAEALWEKASGYNLFEYSETGDLSMNLIFDERQSLSNEINSLEEDLDAGQKGLKAQQEEYDRLSRAFSQRLQAFNKEVNSYNTQGGAPPAVYDRLIEEQEQLEQEAKRLETLAGKLNKDVSLFNQQVGKLNKTVDNFSDALSQRPEEGIYLGEQNRIEIYFVVSKNELIHTIAHELGHSVGIGHHEDKSGVMYPFTTEVVNLSAEDMALVTEACRKLTFFDRLGNSISYFAQKYAANKE